MWCRDLRLSLPQTDNTRRVATGRRLREIDLQVFGVQTGVQCLCLSRTIPDTVGSFFASSPIISSAQELALFQPPGFYSYRINPINALQHVYHCAITWLRGRQAEPRSVSGERDV